MSIIDRVTLLICLAVFLATAFVADQVYENLPHIEDEMAFVWQARVIARGQLTVPSPQPNPDSFLVPFVVDFQGQRFGKYPIGWPVVLAAGERLQLRNLINPILTAAAIWLIYRLGKKLFDELTGLLAAFLGAASPFVLLVGGSLLSHPMSLVLALIFMIGWLDAFFAPNPSLPIRVSRLLPAITAALALGLLALTRPWTAVGLALPFALHGLFLLLHADRVIRKYLVLFSFLFCAVTLMYFGWQYAVTSDPFLNPYTLWWPYDKVGFGEGIGLNPGGHDLHQAYIHTMFSLRTGSTDLFGWPMLSWLFLPLGLYAARKDQRTLLVTAAALSLIIAYAMYWTPSWKYGPRYYYEGLAGPLLLTTVGIRWLAGRFTGGSPKSSKLRFAGSIGLVSILMISNLIFYLPGRLSGIQDLNGVSRSCIKPFETFMATEETPTLIFVHRQQHFFEYACLIELNSPFLDSDIVLAISRSPEIDQAVAEAFPDRNVRHYYPDTRRFTLLPREIPFP